MMTNKNRFFSEEEIMLELYDRVVHGSPAGLQFANAVVEFLKEIPAADVVEVVHGQWEKYPSEMYRRCSVCKVEYEVTPKFNVRPNYCPHCGAKMDGERKDGASDDR